MKVQIDQKVLETLLEALDFYANPDTYWACSFIFDRPTGGFDDDFSDHKEYGDFLDGNTLDCYYEDRERPGMTARKALREFLEKERELLDKLEESEDD